MEVGGEWEKEGSGWRGVWALQLVGGSDTADGGLWPGEVTADAFPKAGHVLSRLPGHRYALAL